MSSAETVDFESLLAPIPGDKPGGESIRYAGPYDAIEEARPAEVGGGAARDRGREDLGGRLRQGGRGPSPGPLRSALPRRQSGQRGAAGPDRGDRYPLRAERAEPGRGETGGRRLSGSRRYHRQAQAGARAGRGVRRGGAGGGGVVLAGVRR